MNRKWRYGDIIDGEDLTLWHNRMCAVFRHGERRKVYESWMRKCYLSGFAHGWDLHKALGAWHNYAVLGIQVAEAVGWIERCDAPWHPQEAIRHNFNGESLDIMRTLKDPKLWQHLPPTSWGWTPRRNMISSGGTVESVLAEFLGRGRV